MFKHIDLKLPKPDFRDSLVEMIVKLETLRGNEVKLEVNEILFNQLKEIFHKVESLCSARIEGNRTTISDYVQSEPQKRAKPQSIEEIYSIERAMFFIDECFRRSPNMPINSVFISEMHNLITKDLNPSEEGSYSPGKYRTNDVVIKNAQHTPPMNVQVPEYMDELIAFINTEDSLQNVLLKVAIAHHRFVWIHPFDNGNGRMSRILTYAMLKQAKFDKISLLNPAAIFCINRSEYFDKLTRADTGDEEGLLDWCRFVLSGLLNELTKLRKLLDGNYFRNTILKPAIANTHYFSIITADEVKILNLSIEKTDNFIAAKDIAELFPNKKAHQITYMINKMVESGLLCKENDHSRKYLINLMHHGLLMSIIGKLSDEGFTGYLDK